MNARFLIRHVWKALRVGWFILALFSAACQHVGGDSVGDTGSLSPFPMNQTPTAIPAVGNQVGLPNLRLPVHFERVLDEFMQGLDAPNQVIQDHLGFIWIATNDGLVRFDGYQFLFYEHDPDDPASISSNQITALLEDRTGRLWVGTYGGGLEQYDRDRNQFIHYRHHPEHPKSISDNKITALLEDRQGNLWVGTASGGLNRLDSRAGDFIRFQHNPAETISSEQPSSLASDSVNALLEDRLGQLWVGTSGGLDRLNPGTDTFYHYQYEASNPASVSHNHILSLLDDSQGQLWVGTNGGGLNRLDPANDYDPLSSLFIHYQLEAKNPHSLSNDVVSALVQDRNGFLWVGTQGGGINRIDPRTRSFTRFLADPADSHSLSSGYIRSLFIDRTGILWISTARALEKYDPYKEKFSQQFKQDHVTALYEDRNGTLWVGAYDGLYRYDQEIDQVTHYRYDPNNQTSLSAWRVSALCEDRSGFLWIGTAGGGLNRLNPGTQVIRHYRYDPRDPYSLRSDRIQALYVDQLGTLWVGTDSGLLRFDRLEERFIKILVAEGVQEPAGAEIIRVILEDHLGQLWIGTQGGGLKRYDPVSGLLTTFRHDLGNPQSLRNNVIYALFEDTAGRMWIGTEGGLHLFSQQDESFYHYGVEDGLPDDEIYAILEDQSGNLWLGTDHGLARFNLQAGSFRTYDVGDGLQANQFSGAAFRRQNGEMLFGGINGISAFYPDQIQDNPHIPPVVLVGLRQDRQPVMLGQSIETAADLTFSGLTREVEFEVAALSYSQPERNQYAYLLEEPGSGTDSDWNYIGTERTVSFSNLAGGNYTLHFKGANDDGVWNEAGISVQITIIPPFWQTTWFWSLAGLVVIGGAFAGYRIRVISVEARNRELEALVAERTRQIDSSRRELEALVRADEHMHRHLDLGQVLQALIDVAVDLLHADKSAVLLWDEKRETFTVQNGRGFCPQTLATLANSASLASLVAGETGFKGQPKVSDSPSMTQVYPGIIYDAGTWREQGDLSQVVEFQSLLDEGVKTWIFLPFEVESQFRGVFNISFLRPIALDDHEIRLYQALVQRACLALENACLYTHAQELAVIKERNRLARDLHDSVKQKTFAALAQLGASRRLLQQGTERAQVHLQEAENLVHDVLQELVFLIQEMYPVALTEHGLREALCAYTVNWSEQSGISIELSAPDRLSLPLEVEQALYRVVQEALANVARHSHARSAWVNLAVNDSAVTLVILDDGQGCNPAIIHPGLGLRSMRERVETLGGKMAFLSAPSQGTRVEISIPCDRNRFLAKPDQGLSVYRAITADHEHLVR